MVKFLRPTYALVHFLTALLSIVPLASRTQPVAFSKLFTAPDGTPCQRPCLFGVQPGETSYQAAIQLLREHPFTHGFSPDIARETFSGDGLSVILYSGKNDLVTRIDLVRTEDSAQTSWGMLGQVMAFLGAPDFVGVDAQFTRSYFLHGSTTLVHDHTTPDSLSVDKGFDTLSVQAHPLSMPSDEYLAPWLGFSNFSHYHDKMLRHHD